MNHNEAHLAFSGRVLRWGKKKREIESSRRYGQPAKLLAASPQVGQPGPIHPSTYQSRCAASGSRYIHGGPYSPINHHRLFARPTRARLEAAHTVHREPGPRRRRAIASSSSSHRRGSSLFSPAAFQFQARRPATAGVRRRHLAAALHLRVTSATIAAGGCGTGGCAVINCGFCPVRSGELLPEDGPGTGNSSSVNDLLVFRLLLSG